MAKFGFPKRLRLLKKKEYDRAIKIRKGIRSRHYYLCYTHNDLAMPRLGIIASKRNTRRSVERNRIRRIIKEYFRQHQHQLPHCDIVVIVRRLAIEANNHELVNSLHRLCQKLPGHYC